MHYANKKIEQLGTKLDILHKIFKKKFLKKKGGGGQICKYKVAKPVVFLSPPAADNDSSGINSWIF